MKKVSSLKKLIIFGCGGFAAGDLTWLIEDINAKELTWDLLGYIDDNKEEHGKIKKGYKVLGGIDWLDENPDTYCVMGIGVGKTRELISDSIRDKVLGFPTLIHPSVHASKHIEVGEGCILLPNALISGGSKIGNFVILNLACTIGHDVILEDYATVSPGANLSGYARVGRYSDIGTGATVRQLIKIGQNTVIGASSAVVSDIGDSCVAVGVPAKVIKQK
jgi:sugar O-acyltransferase (sialic acid O-acetyltransferase NeuD family)